VLALGVLGLARLLRTAEARPASPTEAELARAAAIVARSPHSAAALALLGDKALLFPPRSTGPADDGFVMYGVEGRSWIAMGDPVGAPAQRAELAWRFREEADRLGAWPVFYQVRAELLPLYIDLGLTFVKLGEEAVVPLRGFTLEGGERKGLRRMLKDGEKRGMTFEVVEAGAVPALLPRLRAVSDDWLSHKAAREKGFSLGRFDGAYLRRFPCALVRVGGPHGEIVAFADLWLGDGQTECSPDLMRHVAAAPKGVMDFLFVSLLQWGAREGFARCNLGMAPLAGLTPRHLAPLWTRAGALIAQHGETYYNFAGLRAYKEKFPVVWEPRYLASPGGLALPRILANVAALIAGGLGGVIRR
ncbi:MAG TPA: phosphatidylglycerol lysyltransferase domain-containing protein, partial [Gemmatimonadaceae bacterium]|nr:phosphatidylglycerol lysyltransferase domain-containing protein [Gemmatimonadaceae bacterium]